MRGGQPDPELTSAGSAVREVAMWEFGDKTRMNRYWNALAEAAIEAAVGDSDGGV